jgi:hypothetical protein
VGLFERTKHLERLAREIADENLRHLGAAPVDEKRTRQQVLELERILREYRLNVDEADARRQLAAEQAEAAREKAAHWNENARLAKARARADLEAEALERAHGHQRDHDAAQKTAEHEAATLARLQSEVAELERRIGQLRALRRGARPAHPTPPPGRVPGTTTQRITRLPPRDPIEDEFDRLREDP